MKVIGQFMKGAGYFIALICGIWGLIEVLRILVLITGFWGTFIGLMFFPLTMVAVPVWAGFAHSYWFPLILIYGGGMVFMILFGIGNIFAPEEA